MPLTEIDGKLFVTVEVDPSGYFDAQNAALFIGRTPGYVRTLARKGTLAFVLDEEEKMIFHRDVLEAYNAAPKRGGRVAGAIPYRTLSSVGRKLRSVILLVEATEFASDANKAVAVAVLQKMLDANIAGDDEEVVEEE